MRSGKPPSFHKQIRFITPAINKQRIIVNIAKYSVILTSCFDFPKAVFKGSISHKMFLKFNKYFITYIWTCISANYNFKQYYFPNFMCLPNHAKIESDWENELLGTLNIRNRWFLQLPLAVKLCTKLVKGRRTFPPHTPQPKHITDYCLVKKPLTTWSVSKEFSKK